MKVLLASPVPHYLEDAITNAGDRLYVTMDPPEQWPDDIDFIVSLGYRHIIKEPYLSQYADRAINIHISLLPWNRGADPNFWSWFDRTPKGVTIHLIDEGIDTGSIISRLEISLWDKNETLRSSYMRLMRASSILFETMWPVIRKGWAVPEISQEEGSYHRLGEREQWWGKLSAGWDTPVKEVEELGSSSKDN